MTQPAQKKEKKQNESCRRMGRILINTEKIRQVINKGKEKNKCQCSVLPVEHSEGEDSK